jgi:hypothetical protein
MASYPNRQNATFVQKRTDANLLTQLSTEYLVIVRGKKIICTFGVQKDAKKQIRNGQHVQDTIAPKMLFYIKNFV